MADTSDYKLDKQGKKIKAHRIVFSKGEDDGKGGVTENMKKSFSSFIEQHAALLEAKCSECGEEKHDGDCEMQESRSHSIIATKLKQIDARKTRDADALKRHNEMLSSIATSDASPEHKKSAIDALNKKGVTEASNTMQRYGQLILKRARAARDAEANKEKPQTSTDTSSTSTRDLLQQLRRPNTKKKRVSEEGGAGVTEGFPHDVDHMSGKTIKHQDTNCTTCHGRKSMYKLGNKLSADNKQGAEKVKCPTCKGTGDKQGVTEAKADPLGSWISHKEFTNPKIFKTREGAKAHAEKTGGTVNSSEGYHKLKKEQIKEDKNMQNQQIDELSVNKMLKYTDAANKNREVLNKKWDTGTATEREKNKVLSHEKGEDRAGTLIKAKTGKNPNEIGKLSRMKYAITREETEQMDEAPLRAVSALVGYPKLNRKIATKGTPGSEDERNKAAAGLRKDRSGLGRRAYTGDQHYDVRREEVEQMDEKHLVNVTMSDPNHTMVSKRKETMQRRASVTAKDREHAIDTAIKHYEKQGYKVHDHQYVGMKEEALKGNQHKLDKNKNGKVDRHDFKLLRKEDHIEESSQNVAAHVKTNKYSWGTMKTVHQGSSFSIPLHPEHHEAIAKLKDQQEHKFKDETGHHWTAKRQGDDVHFQGANDGNSTKVPHKAIAESKEDVPFDGPYKSVFKKPNNPNRTGMDAARALAQRAAERAKKEKMKEEKKTFKDFLNDLNEIKMSDLPKRTVKGNSYGAQYHDPEGDDDADTDKKKPQPNTTEKRGRGRPAGSKSGANFGAASKNKSGVEYTGYKLHLPNSNR